VTATKIHLASLVGYACGSHLGTLGLDTAPERALLRGMQTELTADLETAGLDASEEEIWDAAAA
jgi:hypothetical protein